MSYQVDLGDTVGISMRRVMTNNCEGVVCMICGHTDIVYDEEQLHNCSQCRAITRG